MQPLNALMIDHYLEDHQDEPQVDPEDALAQAALVAFGHVVDECATHADLLTLRAWAVELRMTGMTEREVASLAAVADNLARTLGVP